MNQLTLWQAPPVERRAKVSVFRRLIKTKVYIGERQLVRFFDVMDFVLFTSDGQITEDEGQAAYVITRLEGVRIWYAAWYAHCPEPYQRELIFKMDAGHAYRSVDSLAWKWFTKTNRVIALNTATDYRSIG